MSVAGEPATKKMSPAQKELVLEWMAAQRDPFTVDDIAEHYGVHYQTAFAWLAQLRHEALVTEHPFKRGRRKQFLKSDKRPEQEQMGDPEDAAIRVVRGTEMLSLSRWAEQNIANSNTALVAHGLCYLFLRSYYADDPENQHLRGTTPVVEVRAMLTEYMREMERDVEAVKQMLSYSGPWVEGSELARRFGSVDNLMAVAEKAAIFEKLALGRKGMSS